VGQLNLPLTTTAASGTKYRLRHATFHVRRQDAVFEDAAGSGPGNGDTVVSSETDLNAPTISLSLEEGFYSVELQPGWSFEKLGQDGSQSIEVTLLSGATQWVWVARQSTSWAQYDFGIGGREIWLNGQVNISINVQERPGGDAGAAGAPEVGPSVEAGAGGALSY
jgi:hypothetical protein